MRDLSQLFGHQSAEAEFLAAYKDGRLHHGWLIEGASGIGKAQLALRLAVRLLGGDPQAPDDKVSGLVLSGAHPDLRWLKRSPDDKGKWPIDIPVKDARALNQFFELKPALGGMRVGIIDSVDELNRFGANALLKTLEEPPRNCVLMLLHHGQKPLMPTLRSRCRSLKLQALNSTDTATLLNAMGETDFEDIAALVPGRPGKIVSLASENAREAVRSAERLKDTWPKPSDTDLARFTAIAGSNAEAVEAGQLALQRWFSEKARSTSGREQQNWSCAWLVTVRNVSEARDLAMEPRQVCQFMMKTLSSLAASR